MQTNTYTSIQRKLRLLIIGSLFLIIAGLLSAWNTPCTGYEPNIYAATPILFWIGLFACYLTGMAIILVSEFYKPLPRQIIILAYIQMILAFIALILLTIIRGYKILNVSGDGGTHIGSLLVTVTTGQVPYTYYPGIYVEPAIFQILTGIDVQTVLSIFPMFMLCLFTIGVCLIAKRIFPYSGEICLATIIALLTPIGSSLIFGTSVLLFAGMTISNVGLLPIFVYAILRCVSGLKMMLFPLLLLSLSILFYHPYVTVICFIIYVAVILFYRLPFFGRGVIHNRSLRQIIVLFIITLGAFFAWYWSFFGRTIISGIRSIFEAASASDRGIGNSVDLLKTASDLGYGFDTVMKIAGINLFIYGMLFIAGILFLCKYWKDNRYLLMKVLFVCVGAIGVMMVISMAGDFSGGWGRFLNLIYIASLLSCGFVLYRLLSVITHHFTRISHAKIGMIFVICAIVCFASVMTFHPSPYTYNPGYQTTQTEFTAAENMLPHIDNNKNSTGIYFTGIYRYIYAIYGSSSTVGSYEYGSYHIISTTKSGTDYAEIIPYHFGYDKMAESLADIYEVGETIFIIEKDKKLYQAYYPELIPFRWTTEDFAHLEMDGGLEMVYNNGGVEMYYIFK